MSQASYLPLRLAKPQHSAVARRDTPTADPQFQLNHDPDFHFEILRVLGLAPYGGADIGEVLIAAGQIKPGDFESFADAFTTLANRAYKAAQAIDQKKYPISARDAMFKAATYFRAADFYLHGNWTDPRINSLWTQHLTAFNSALALLPSPAERVVLNGPGFKIPAVFYSCGLPGRRPTLVLGNGYDGAQEEMYHVMVQAALQRGMHAITYEGPGQPTVRREQNLGFIPQWEKVVTPVVDYLLTRGDVESKAVGLMGYSFGGTLAPRAAAFEHRLAAVIALDGQYDFGPATLRQLGPKLEEALAAGNASMVNYFVELMLADPSNNDTASRWALQQGMWAFNAPTPYDYFKKMQNYTLEGVVGNITMPVFVGDAENDLFGEGQGKLLAAHLGSLATYHFFSNAEGAGAHCSVGAAVLQNQVALDWFQDLLAKNGHN